MYSMERHFLCINSFTAGSTPRLERRSPWTAANTGWLSTATCSWGDSSSLSQPGFSSRHTTGGHYLEVSSSQQSEKPPLTEKCLFLWAIFCTFLCFPSLVGQPQAYLLPLPAPRNNRSFWRRKENGVMPFARAGKEQDCIGAERLHFWISMEGNQLEEGLEETGGMWFRGKFCSWPSPDGNSTPASHPNCPLAWTVCCGDQLASHIWLRSWLYQLRTEWYN